MAGNQAKKPKGTKVSKFIRLDRTVVDRIAKLAKKESRSWSAMAALILERGSQ